MPNTGLGFKQALDGNQTHEFDFRVTKVNNMSKDAVSMRLSQSEANTMLNRRLTPQTTYIMRLLQFNEKQCHQLDKIVLQTFLPLMVINRSIPRAIVHGPLQYGGMAIIKHSPPPRPMGHPFLCPEPEMEQNNSIGHPNDPQCIPTCIRVCMPRA